MTKYAPMSETTSLGRRSCTSARKPPSRSPSVDPSGVRPGGALLAPILATRNAERSSAPDIAAKTAPGPDTASSTPATAGPPNMLRLSIQPAVTFAAVSSSGVLASEGKEGSLRRPGQGYAGGRQRGQGIDDRNGRPGQEGGRRHPHGQRLDQVPRKQHSSRLYLSPSREATGAKIMAGTSCTTPIAPAAAAPPAS